MSGSNRHGRVAVVLDNHMALIREILNATLEGFDFEETLTKLGQTPEVLLRVAQYTKPADMVQSVCNHPVQIIALQKENTDLKTRLFLPPQIDCLETEGRIRIFTNKLNKARM